MSAADVIYEVTQKMIADAHEQGRQQGLRESTDYAEALHHALSSEVVSPEYAGGDDKPQTGWYCSLCDETWGASEPAHAETCVLRRRGAERPDGCRFPDCECDGLPPKCCAQMGHEIGTGNADARDAARWRAFSSRVWAEPMGRGDIVAYRFPTMMGDRSILKGSVVQHFEEAVDAKWPQPLHSQVPGNGGDRG